MDGCSADAIEAYRDAVNPYQVEVLDRLGLLRTFVDAAGEHITDSTGRRYLDLVAAHGAAILGHRHPKVVAALTETLHKGSPFVVPLGLPTRTGQLAQRLCDLAGGALRRVYFCTGGSEAIENAMKFAMAATGREAFVAFGNGFHGFTPGPLPLAGHDFWRLPLPHWAPAGRISVPFGDVEQLEKVLARGEVAAVLVEAVQGLGGARPWPADELRAVARICAEHGTLLVADEILTGIGRTGRWFAYQHAGVEPDVVVVSKGLTGAMVPVAAVLMTPAVHQGVYASPQRAFIHGSTFQGHLLGMVSGSAVLDVMTEENLVERAVTTGALLRGRLEQLQAEGVGLTGVRGRGMLLGAQVRGISEPGAPDGAIGAVMALHQRGVLVEAAAHDQSWLRLTPPLVMSEESVTYFVDALRDSLLHIHK
jgi:ornithine--oxo-acid transaminase